MFQLKYFFGFRMLLFDKDIFPFDLNWMKDYIEYDALPELSNEEINAITEHRRGNQSHLLKEGIIVFANGVIITKTIDESLDIPDFINRVMESCGNSFKIFIGNINDIIGNILIP